TAEIPTNAASVPSMPGARLDPATLDLERGLDVGAKEVEQDHDRDREVGERDPAVRLRERVRGEAEPVSDGAEDQHCDREVPGPAREAEQAERRDQAEDARDDHRGRVEAAVGGQLGEPEVRDPRSFEPQQQHEYTGHHQNDRHHGDADRSAHLHPPRIGGAQRRLPARSYRYSRYPMSPGERPASVSSVAASACCWAAWLTMCMRYCHSGRRSFVNAELAGRPTSASVSD